MMTQYTLRPATSEDYHFLYHLIEVCLKEYVAATWGWDDDFQQRHFAQHFDVTGCQIILVDGRPAGQRTVVERGEELFLAAIYLLPEYQNRGLGSALIREIIVQAEQSGRPVTLQVLKANRPARRLYERLGFFISGETNTHYEMRREVEVRARARGSG
ncbi:MAG: GNAT family N-acetyltransferase [Chloroflexi bacterium]|nr:GNAT family N-acetyltransferase [Chloroflexota bacterium]MCI0577659.1 GNAT family N-acetyltransferase [Chloroflexota bacterium]MCI0644876.1 GNAT family N-acetyltransferase [Chloroflexota bacterium]MCI0725832.1 GNAT family N-acetyltransferase [Chloroflexota bacterium]